ncbi:hypothetical protein ANME2D_02057 [Candidatus Methanoperedens nitroreducens]|uniref:Uncharacterized protein n=1 Tax=Candidatus Methanoperedens nitratireducens TaxID=1392998 RepID=A0A062V7G7_9EURY|nr:HEAT repeat domain-containing protein [Candidatus Methanoperedens nitroreducens]KCZ71330.1 hypothetical protein ANME2D_02057 [Candidatus Methanoperedens nitroreducens]MDJ1420959.1 HEAT repeat domain-containing protein [Candidatus Methanoperedens sp.]
MVIQQDEKVENVKDIFNNKNILRIEIINKKLNSINHNDRIDGLKLAFKNYTDLPKNEAINILTKAAKDESKPVRLWILTSFNGILGKNIPIEVRRDISRLLLKTDDDEIKQKAIEFLNVPVENKPNTSTSNELIEEMRFKQTEIFKNNINDFPKNDLNYKEKKSELSQVQKEDNELKEYILCLTLWMGGDGAIFNLRDILQYLPNNENDIKRNLEELRQDKILRNVNGNYSLTKRGSILADSILLKIIARWNNASEWVNQQGYATIHHGFIEDRRNTALSNLYLSSRSFITDYFQFVLENLVEYYSYKKISYFSNFRRILIFFSLNPTLDFLRSKREEFEDVIWDFSNNEVVKTVDYNNEKLIVIKNDLLRRRNKEWNK